MNPAETDRPYTVVVGVSVTSTSSAALVWAQAQAKAHRGRLVAVRVVKRGQGGSGHEAELTTDVAEVLGSDHGAECRVLYGGRRSSLLAAAGDADLLVIDTAHRPSSSSQLAQRVIAGAQCPVVVMPPAIADVPPAGLARAGRAVGKATLRAVGTSGRPGYRPPERP